MTLAAARRPGSVLRTVRIHPACTLQCCLFKAVRAQWGSAFFQSEERAQWAAALAQERLREKRPDVDEGALLLAHEAAVAAAKQANVRRRSRSQRHDDYIVQRVVPLPKSGALTPP